MDSDARRNDEVLQPRFQTSGVAHHRVAMIGGNLREAVVGRCEHRIIARARQHVGKSGRFHGADEHGEITTARGDLKQGARRREGRGGCGDDGYAEFDQTASRNRDKAHKTSPMVPLVRKPIATVPSLSTYSLGVRFHSIIKSLEEAESRAKWRLRPRTAGGRGALGRSAFRPRCRPEY